MTTKNLVQQMQHRAQAVQAVVRRINDRQAAFRYALDLTLARGGRGMAVAGFEGGWVEARRPACTAAGIELLDTAFRDHAENLHTALTPADWGIADTGTLVIDSASEDLRLATMLAEVHVALLPVSKIRPDAASLETLLDTALKSAAPSYLAFITGASRTADIERVLAIGVHGPRELHILLME